MGKMPIEQMPLNKASFLRTVDSEVTKMFLYSNNGFYF